MERRHWEPDHPAVMSWADRNHKRHARQVEWSVAYRRRQVGERARQARLAKRRDTVKGQALIGLAMIIGSGFVFDNSERVGGSAWLWVGALLGGGGALWVDAIRKATN